MPKCLPPGCAHCCRGFFQRAAHSLQDGHDHAESQWKRNENIREDYRIWREHYLHIGRQKSPKQTIWPPQKQQSKTRNRSRYRGWDRNNDDDRVAAPKSVTRENIGSEKTE